MTVNALPSPIELFQRASRRAAAVMAGVRPEQLSGSTPCSEWTVQQLMDHMVGGTDYLSASLDGTPPHPRSGATVADYRTGISQVLTGLQAPGALDRTCLSPLNFEWSVGQAVAGTFMDHLIHTWDLATATGQEASLDPELVEACTVMFLPAMPEMGRASGLVGPAVEVAAGASPQVRLLGAMGRRA